LRIAATDRGPAEDRGRSSRWAIADRDATMPGRGAYLCLGADPGLPAEDCLTSATRRGGIARALRASVKLDPKLVESVKRVAQPADGRPAGPLAISKP
jgi:predicted RNA-binding protein YlxR (DUF448 family)